MELQGKILPDVVFKTREYDETSKEANPFKWVDKTTDDLFENKRVVVFSLPGAFTPTCSNKQLPNFEELYGDMKALHIDDVYCVSVNDAFVMYAWKQHQGVSKVKLIPDGSGKFTEALGMLVDKDNLGFGKRSWRYAMVVSDSVIENAWVEPGMEDNCPTDPYGETAPENVMSYLTEVEDRFKARSADKKG